MKFIISTVLYFLVFCVIPSMTFAGIGQPDVDNDYANVGVLIIFDTDVPEDPIGANVSTFCSGVLISESYNFV